MMATLVHRFSTPLSLGDRVYLVEAWGERPDGHLWEGWIEFVPTDGGPVLATARETSQGTLEALAYWATGLQPVYLDGALARAIQNVA
jgi:hypothetical protein